MNTACYLDMSVLYCFVNMPNMIIKLNVQLLISANVPYTLQLIIKCSKIHFVFVCEVRVCKCCLTGNVCVWPIVSRIGGR